MADLEDARRIARSLPGTVGDDGFAVMRAGKPSGFVWVWNQRIEPKKPRVPCPEVLAIRTANLEEKELLLASEPEKFFTEPHYNGYPAVLLRLASVECDELEELLVEAWSRKASKAMLREYEARLAGVEPDADDAVP